MQLAKLLVCFQDKRMKFNKKKTSIFVCNSHFIRFCRFFASSMQFSIELFFSPSILWSLECIYSFPQWLSLPFHLIVSKKRPNFIVKCILSKISTADNLSVKQFHCYFVPNRLLLIWNAILQIHLALNTNHCWQIDTIKTNVLFFGSFCISNGCGECFWSEWATQRRRRICSFSLVAKNSIRMVPHLTKYGGGEAKVKFGFWILLQQNRNYSQRQIDLFNLFVHSSVRTLIHLSSHRDEQQKKNVSCAKQKANFGWKYAVDCVLVSVKRICQEGEHCEFHRRRNRWNEWKRRDKFARNEKRA